MAAHADPRFHAVTLSVALVLAGLTACGGDTATAPLPAGKAWGTATLIETDNTGSAYDPRVAMDASGNALVVWQQPDGVRYNIWSNRYTAGTGWGAAALLESDNSGDANAPQIALGANGNALAVWYQSDGTRTNIWSNRFQ